MNSIIDNQREILLSVEGTNIWSGQQPQQYNSQAIAWGWTRARAVREWQALRLGRLGLCHRAHCTRALLARAQEIPGSPT